MGKVLEVNNKIVYLGSMLETIKQEPLTIVLIESLLHRLIPKDDNGNLLVGYNVKEKGRNPAIYYPRYNIIEVDLISLMEWVDGNGNDLASLYNIEDTYKLKLYLVLMAIMHEVEHSYQYLIANGKIKTSCLMLKEGYKTLTELMVPKDYVLPRPIKQVRRVVSVIKYKQRENEFLLERNAQYNSLDDLSKVAFHLGDYDIAKMFVNMRDLFGRAGYMENVDGMVINTLRDICMGDKAKNYLMIMKI